MDCAVVGVAHEFGGSMTMFIYRAEVYGGTIFTPIIVHVSMVPIHMRINGVLLYYILSQGIYFVDNSVLF